MSQIRKGERVTRREFLMGTGLATGAALGARLGRGEAQGLRTITASHSVSTFVYGQHLVAAQKRFFEEEGLKTPDFVVPGGGAKVVQALAAGQVMFALGDSNHPLKITEKGRAAALGATRAAVRGGRPTARRARVARGGPQDRSAISAILRNVSTRCRLPSGSLAMSASVSAMVLP